MLIKCEHCGTYMDDGDKFCPMCGAPNAAAQAAEPAPVEEAPSPLTLDPNGEEQLQQAAEEVLQQADQALGVPQTIEELRRFAVRHSLPLSQMRVHLGEDYRGARAYGIYRDETGQFVVYKNKSNGQRAIRYQGPDEARAVRELYEKMQEKLAQQKRSRQGYGPGSDDLPPSQQPYRQPMVNPPSTRKKSGGVNVAIIILAILFGVNVGLPLVGRVVSGIRSGVSQVFGTRSPRRGYYRYGGNVIYRDDDNWYLYDDSTDLWNLWYLTDHDWFYDHYDDYYESYRYEDAAGYSDFYGGTYDYEQDADQYSYSADSDDDWSWDWDDDNDWDWDDDYDWDDSWDDWDSDW